MRIHSPSMAAPWIVFLLLILGSPLRPAYSGQSPAAISADNFDGPAELPRENVKSSLSDTPAGGKTWTVRSGQNLEQVLAGASCGDIVQLQAGITLSGSFVLPNKSCDDAHWIILRTSAPDSSLPRE